MRATLDNRLHRSPWLFLSKKAGQPMSTYAGQNIYYSALKKSGVRYKGGIHTLRHYPEFRTIPSKLAVTAPKPLLMGLGAASDAGQLGIVLASTGGP